MIFLIIWVMQENVSGFEFRTPASRVRTRVDNDLLLRKCLLTFGASERIHLRQFFRVSRPLQYAVLSHDIAAESAPLNHRNRRLN